jgi:hypothetical protein
MSRNVARLQARFQIFLEEFEKIMPEQYRVSEPPNPDQVAYESRALHEHWWRAWDSLYGAEDYLSDLASLLELRATRHAATTATDEAADDLNDDEDGQTQPEADDPGDAVPGTTDDRAEQGGPGWQRTEQASQRDGSGGPAEPAATEAEDRPAH